MTLFQKSPFLSETDNNRWNTARQMAITFILSQYEKEEVYLNQEFNPELQSIGPQFKEACEGLKLKLNEIEQIIQARNCNLVNQGLPSYPWLLPFFIPCSIAV